MLQWKLKFLCVATKTRHSQIIFFFFKKSSQFIGHQWQMSQYSHKLDQTDYLRNFSCSSVQFSHSVVSDSLRLHESQHTRPPCPSQIPRVYSNPCLLSQWCHPVISSSAVPFSSCPQSLPASGSFQMSQLFTWGGQSIGVSASASVPPMNTQDWSP